jgi:hypothetical protein
MHGAMFKILTTLCKDRRTAELALEVLDRAAIDREDVSLLISDAAAGREFQLKENTKTSEGAAAGALLGGSLGALAASLVAAGAIVAPGIGLMAAGPILASLAGAGAGGAAGTLVGALIGSGFPEHEARLASRGLEEGQILLAVRVPEERESAMRELLSTVVLGAVHVSAAND